MTKIKVGDSFRTINEASEYAFGFKTPRVGFKPAADFHVKGDYWAWFARNTKGWNDISSETEIKVSHVKLTEEKCRERERLHKSRKFVTFIYDHIEKHYKFAGVFEFVCRKGDEFLYERTATEYRSSP